MIEFLQISVFVLITVWALKYMMSKKVDVKHPFEKHIIVSLSGTQRFFLFTLAIGILQIGEFSALRLLVSILLVSFAVFYDKNRFVISLASVLYALFLIWLLVAITYSPTKMYGIRVFLKYLFPFLILLLASKITDSPIVVYKNLRTILKVGVWGSLFILVLNKIPLVSIISWNLMWWPPAILDFLGVPVAIVLAYYTLNVKKKYLPLLFLFILPCIIGVNRTGLLVICVTITVFALVRYNLRSLPYLVLAGVLFLGAVLYIPAFREKMFYKNLTAEEIIENRESLSTEDINSSGRFAMWDWSMKRYFKGKELTGSGLGVLQDVFYSKKHPFGDLEVVHNDYVQLLCDTGIIGLGLYLSVFLTMLTHSILVFYRKNRFTVRLLALIAASSICGVAVALYTDNAVNYSLMTLTYPFAIYGMMIGLKSRSIYCNE